MDLLIAFFTFTFGAGKSSYIMAEFIEDISVAVIAV